MDGMHECIVPDKRAPPVTAGGQGIDLSFAGSAVFMEIPPDCGWVRQAEDRVHRRGQEGCVHIYYLVSSNPPLYALARLTLLASQSNHAQLGYFPFCRLMDGFRVEGLGFRLMDGFMV